MKICLISPPTVTDFEDPSVAETVAIRLIAEHAPIGILSLAAVLERDGHSPSIVDLNQWYYAFLRSPEGRAAGRDFCNYVVERLCEREFDVLGLSSICSSYPLTLRIAGGFKRSRPDVPIIVGGPQASVVDVSTLQHFPCIDYVVRGEAEATLPRLLESLGRPGRLTLLPGITFRTGGRVVRNQAAPIIEDLDALPMPAFHLFEGLKQCHYVPLELGRGCPFACTFCSTNDFFRRNFRLKSPDKLLAEMRTVRSQYGISTFDLIHDMFTVDRRRVVAFCDALLASGESFTWNCSARTDCVDEELLALMASAGCRGIFYGIETGSARLQKVVNKKIDLGDAMTMVEAADRHRIRTAVSLISGFPDETRDDLRDTVAFMLDALRFDHAAPQFHLLAPLVETPLFTRHREELILDDIVSDMSYQGWRQAPADRALIAAHKDVFGNFYSVPTPFLDRSHLKELRDFLLNGFTRMRWLLVAVHQYTGDIISVFDAWRGWLASKGLASGDSAEVSQYYSNIQFANDFKRFLIESFLPGNEDTTGITAIIEYDAATLRLSDQNIDRRQSDASAKLDATSNGARPEAEALGISERAVPHLRPGVHTFPLQTSYREVLELLRQKIDLRTIQPAPVTLAVRPTVGTEVDVLQLSAMSAAVLSLCDGNRSVAEIAREFASDGLGLAGIPADKVCRFGLEVLLQQGLLSATVQSQ